MSSAFSQGFNRQKEWPGFKTTAMLLKMAGVPEYAAKLIVIVDDKRDVWHVPSDAALVHAIRPQRFSTSHGKPSAEQALNKFAAAARELWHKVYDHPQPPHAMRLLIEYEKEVSWVRHAQSHGRLY